MKLDTVSILMCQFPFWLSSIFVQVPKKWSTMYATDATAANAMVFDGVMQTLVHPATIVTQAYSQLIRIEGKKENILLCGEVNSTRSEKNTEIKKAKNRHRNWTKKQQQNELVINTFLIAGRAMVCLRTQNKKRIQQNYYGTIWYDDFYCNNIFFKNRNEGNEKENIQKKVSSYWSFH